MPIKLRDGQTLLFIGDSITDCGRRGPDRPLGSGYVKLFGDLLTLREPARRVTLINKGISGDRVTGLLRRWSDDVLRHRPDWLAVKIGINDLHSHLHQAPDAVDPDRFREAYTSILDRTRRALPDCRLLLIDPFYISGETAPGTFRRAVLDLLPAYLDTVAALGRRHRARRVRTHEIFQRLLVHHDPDTFCPEPVHPNLAGHLVIAEAVYDALCR